MRILLIFSLCLLIQSCSSIKSSSKPHKLLSINNFKIEKDSLIGTFCVTSECVIGTINLYDDNTCQITPLPGCYSCIVFDTYGNWRIKGRYLILENNPKYKYTLIEKQFLNNNYVTFHNIDGYLNLFIYKNGVHIYTPTVDSTGIVKINKSDFDSIWFDNLKLMIYNTNQQNDYYKISGYPINYWIFKYKLLIKKDYSLTGVLNLKKEKCVFYKRSHTPDLKIKLNNFVLQLKHGFP
jgi:hypothetical protein